MQAKDIDDMAVLRFLLSQDGGRKWCTYGEGSSFMPTVAAAMPPGTTWKVQLAKMAKLIKRGLVDGCDCGCRGDFHLTDAGRAFIAREESP